MFYVAHPPMTHVEPASNICYSGPGVQETGGENPEEDMVAENENKIGDSWNPFAACINCLGVRLSRL
jgi:hypothetical protein